MKSEKSFITTDGNGRISQLQPLPCWQDAFQANQCRDESKSTDRKATIEEAEIFISVVVPAYNEENRLENMLKEAVVYLQERYGFAAAGDAIDGVQRRKSDRKPSHALPPNQEPSGWEILVVSDGSVDKTVETALKFAQGLGDSSSSIRVVSLTENRGKGGAVTHGMRHVRGKYAIFADADGASKFEDLGKLLRASAEIEDASGRAIAVGSRAHLVGSEAVVKVKYPYCHILVFHDTNRETSPALFYP